MINQRDLRYLLILGVLLLFIVCYAFGSGWNQVGGSDDSDIRQNPESESRRDDDLPPEIIEKIRQETARNREANQELPIVEGGVSKGGKKAEVGQKLGEVDGIGVSDRVGQKRFIGCNTDRDCNLVQGQGQNRCLGGTCQCDVGTGQFCHLKQNYYKDPKDMTPAQVIKFKKRAKLEKMTVQDYVNWLNLFRFDHENLPPEHLNNFRRLTFGEPIYEVPLTDPLKDLFADDVARREKVCLEIPNADVDSPLNWKYYSQLNNNGEINIKGETQRPLNWARYYKHPRMSQKRMEDDPHGQKPKNLYLNNLNWLFYDLDRNANYKNPNLNRFMNIIDDQKKPTPGISARRVSVAEASVLPTQEGSNVAPNDLNVVPNKLGLKEAGIGF